MVAVVRCLSRHDWTNFGLKVRLGLSSSMQVAAAETNRCERQARALAAAHYSRQSYFEWSVVRQCVWLHFDCSFGASSSLLMIVDLMTIDSTLK